MSKLILKHLGIGLASIVVVSYGVFLAAPLFLNGMVNKYVPKAQKAIDTSTGMKSQISGVQLVTTPKLTVGVKVKSAKINLPTGENLLSANDFSVKLSLLPLVLKKVELDSVSAKDVSVDFDVAKSGKFAFEQYLPQKNDEQSSSQSLKMLPFGIKLSNHLPNISIDGYNISLADTQTGKKYSIEGKNANVSDFILNKKVKVDLDGKVTLDGTNHFNYDLKVLNKIMPDIQLNDLVFASSSENKTTGLPFKAKDIVYLLNGIHKNGVTSNVTADLKTYGTADDVNIDGDLDVENLTLDVNGKPLPTGNVVMNFRKNKIKLTSKVHTSQTDTTEVNGNFKTGKHPKIDLTVKSKADFNDIVTTFDSMFMAFGRKDLNTLKAAGKIDADFNLKSNLKTIESSGYLRITDGNLRYGLYNIAIDDIMADIDLANNMLNIKNTGLKILSNPLKISGTIKQNADCDVNVIADKLQLKGLLLAAGQAGLLKDNVINSGNVSANIALKGKLNKLYPKINVLLSNLNVKNKPSNTYITNESSLVDITNNNKTLTGKVNILNLVAKNPSATVRIPNSTVSFGTKDIVIDKAYLLVNNSRVNVTGKISDYTTKKMNYNIKATGNILASDVKSFVPKNIGLTVRAVGAIPLTASVVGDNSSQDVDFKVIATPSNYVSIIDIDSLKGKNTIINSKMKIKGNSIELSNTGIFANSLSSPVVSVSGAVDKLSSNPQLNSLKILTPSQIGLSIPGFKGSKAYIKANITADGSLTSPSLRGSLSLPSVSIPTMKATLKNITADLSSKLIQVDCPSITVASSKMSAKAKVRNNFTKGIIIDSMNFNSDYIDADALTSAFSSMPSSSGSNNLGITVYSGKGAINKLKSGAIIAENLSSDFGINNNTLQLNNIDGNAFDGKVSGKITYNLLNQKTLINMTGSGMSAVKAIAATTGVKNALSGKLGFSANLNLKATTQDVMMKTANGKVTFNIDDGTFLNVGRLQDFLNAQNILQNAIMKAAVASISALPTIKNTANFKNLSGNVSLANGYMQMNSIKSQGASLCYYVIGRYNLLTGYTNAIVLGRLSADVVGLMGPVGQLSVTKLTSYIPKFGTLTGKVLDAMTTNPNGEKTAEIPALSSGATNYKDFKAVVNGTLGKASSIRSFKWLSTCDTSAIEKLDIKKQIQTTKTEVQNTYNSKVTEAKNRLEAARQAAQQQSQQMQNLKNNLKNMNTLKNLLNTGSGSSQTQGQ